MDNTKMNWIRILVLLVCTTSVLCVGNLGSFFDKVVDLNGDGVFTPDEFLQSICIREEDSYTCQKDMTQLMESFHKIDIEKTGAITKSQFLSFFKRSNLKTPIEGGPQQLHLSLTNNPTEMVITWISRDKDEPSIVQYGLSADSLTSSQQGTIFTYNAGIDGWYGWIHRATLGDLKTATRYYYRVGMPNSWSDVFSFKTAPALSDSSYNKQVVALLADQGTYPKSWELIDLMIASHQEEAFDVVLHAGDICYAGTGHEWEIEEVWDIWEDWVEPIAANVPYMFSVGNHEQYYDFMAYNNRFLMPGAQSGGNGNFWYSFDYGLVHFLCFSTEHPYLPGTPQYAWIEQDLIKANKNRQERPWLIVSAHRPFYCTDANEWDAHRPGSVLPAFFEPLFLQYKVDLYVCGHQHVYERVHPNINGTVVASGNTYTNPAAPVYLVHATGGVLCDLDYVEPQPEWSAVRLSETGFGKMVINETHIAYQFLLYQNGTVGDYFYLQKT